MGICAHFTVQLRQHVPGSKADAAVSSVGVSAQQGDMAWALHHVTPWLLTRWHARHGLFGPWGWRLEHAKLLCPA
jgi:hypothetical protein